MDECEAHKREPCELTLDIYHFAEIFAYINTRILANCKYSSEITMNGLKLCAGK